MDPDQARRQKSQAADLNAAANELALKTFEFAHEGQTMPPLKVPYKPQHDESVRGSFMVGYCA
jgi:hypothetical protein